MRSGSLDEIHQPNLIDSKITSIPGIGDTLGPIILGEIGNVDRFSSVKKLIALLDLILL